MPNYGEQILSKAVNENDISALKRYGLTPEHFATTAERQAFEYVLEYAEKNRGQAPSYATFAAETTVMYIPDVTDSFDWMTDALKESAAKRQLYAYIEGELGDVFSRERSGSAIGKIMQERVEQIILGANVGKSVGKTLSEVKESMRAEFLKREEGKSFKRYDTPFDTLTEAIGGWYTGDVYGVMAESGRGKTYLLGVIIDDLLRQGARVLVKSYEVKEYSWFARLISIITANEGLIIDDDMPEKHPLGIPNKAILNGRLEEFLRENFLEVLDKLDAYYKGQLYFQGKSDSSLTRTLRELDNELSTGQVDVVVLDPFYGLTDVYGNNANKTAGGAAEQAATKFENIVGDHDVIGFYTVQATVEKKREDDEGERELKLPTRDQVKTSKRLLDIASVLLTFDSVKAAGEVGGIAEIGIEKGRNGGEDVRVELISILDYGVLKEPAVDASQFGF